MKKVEGGYMRVNKMEEIKRELERMDVVREKIEVIEKVRVERLKKVIKKGYNEMV